jgi:hypothetical protein
MRTARVKARREGGQTADNGWDSGLTHRPKRARRTTRYDWRGPPSAMLWRTGPLCTLCDETGQTRNCEGAQTAVEQYIAALAFLAKATLFLAGARDGAGAGLRGGLCSAAQTLRPLDCQRKPGNVPCPPHLKDGARPGKSVTCAAELHDTTPRRVILGRDK